MKERIMKGKLVAILDSNDKEKAQEVAKKAKELENKNEELKNKIAELFKEMTQIKQEFWDYLLRKYNLNIVGEYMLNDEEYVIYDISNDYEVDLKLNTGNDACIAASLLPSNESADLFDPDIEITPRKVWQI